MKILQGDCEGDCRRRLKKAIEERRSLPIQHPTPNTQNFYYLCKDSNGGAPILRAEIIPIAPDPGSAGEGKLKSK